MSSKEVKSIFRTRLCLPKPSNATVGIMKAAMEVVKPTALCRDQHCSQLRLSQGKVAPAPQLFQRVFMYLFSYINFLLIDMQKLIHFWYLSEDRVVQHQPDGLCLISYTVICLMAMVAEYIGKNGLCLNFWLPCVALWWVSLLKIKQSKCPKQTQSINPYIESLPSQISLPDTGNVCHPMEIIKKFKTATGHSEVQFSPSLRAGHCQNVFKLSYSSVWRNKILAYL